MARRKSSSKKTDADAAEDSVTAEDSAETVSNGDADGVEDETAAGTDEAEVEASETSSADDAPASDADAEGSDGDPPSEETSGEAVTAEQDETPEPEAEAIEEPVSDAESAPVAATPHTMDHPDRGQSGPGFFPLVLGGIVAGLAGFAGGYFFDLDSGDGLADLTGTLETQGAEISALADQAGALESEIAALAPPEVDLSGIEAEIASVGSRLDGLSLTLGDLDTRLSAVEARPVFTGESDADEAAVAAAIAQLRSDIRAEQDTNAALAANIEAIAEEAANRIAEAEERAAASAEAASAQAAISELRIAIASGSPFAAPLAEVAAAQGLEIPEAVSSVAETGVPTLAEIEAGFPAVARAALPIALQANAGETAGDRLSAFLRSQVGGRALSPQAGDDPDAVLSRAGAAVSAGDLESALEELSALPDPALEAMSDWIAQAARRLSALEAIDGLSGAIGN